MRSLAGEENAAEEDNKKKNNDLEAKIADLEKQVKALQAGGDKKE